MGQLDKVREKRVVLLTYQALAVVVGHQDPLDFGFVVVEFAVQLRPAEEEEKIKRRH